MSNSDTRPRPKITISIETTYVTEPLRADSYVDYVAALNRHCSEGVTPENNAAIPFWQAVGPKEIDKKIRKRYFELLGITELPDEGSYLVSFYDFFQFHKGWKQQQGDTPEDYACFVDFDKQYDRAKSAPWSKEENPLLADLLEKNAGPLRMLVDGLRRPRFYSPGISAERGGFIDLTPMMESREGLRQLTARAMLRIHEGRTVEAWEDILACHRMARLFGQQPFVVSGIIAAALEGLACSGSTAFAQHGNLMAEQARQSLDDLLRLSTKWTVRTEMDCGDRIWLLDSFLMMAAGDYPEPTIEATDPSIADAVAVLRANQESQYKAWRRLGNDPRMNWDEALRHCNVWYDRIVAACDEPTYQKRHESAQKLEKELGHREKRAMEYASATDLPDADPMFDSIAEKFAVMLVGQCVGPLSATLEIEGKSQATFNLACLALALAGYYHDYSGYPKTLTELSPKHIGAIPKDPFTDANLVYKPTADGYLLYSVGANGTDDGGRNYMRDNEDWWKDESATEEEKSWDDIAIRMPPDKAEK